MFISFRVKFDKGLCYEMDIENMSFFCCQVYMCSIKNLELKLEFTVLVYSILPLTYMHSFIPNEPSHKTNQNKLINAMKRREISKSMIGYFYCVYTTRDFQ